METVASLATVDALRLYVLHTLCSHDRLDPAQTPLFQGVITRHGKPCGLLFEAHGPRLLKTHAIWAGHEHRILFYDCTGERFAVTAPERVARSTAASSRPRTKDPTIPPPPSWIMCCLRLAFAGPM